MQRGKGTPTRKCSPTITSHSLPLYRPLPSPSVTTPTTLTSGELAFEL